MKTAHSSQLIAESEKIKVYYPGPGTKTYHPKLGKLITEKEFEVWAKDVAAYLKSGLLKQVKSKEIEGESSPRASSEAILKPNA